MEALEALRVRFADRLSGQLARLTELISEDDHFLDRTEERKELITLCHSIAGAAGTFGYPALSVLASSLEERLVYSEQVTVEEVRHAIQLLHLDAEILLPR